MKIIKKIAVILGIGIGSILILLMLLSFVIQIPLVQNYIVHTATAFIGNATQKKTQINRIGITFPGSIYLKEVFVEDGNNDTLVYAEYAKVTVNLWRLAHGNIHFRSAYLKHAVCKITRTSQDSLYNFQFLVNAFSDTTIKQPATVKPLSAPNITVDKAQVDNVVFIYDDKYNGIYTGVTVKKAQVKMRTMNITDLFFDVKKAEVDGVFCKVELNKMLKKGKPILVWPKVYGTEVKMDNGAFIFNDNIPEHNKKPVTGFNSLHMNFSNIHVRGEKVGYSAHEIKAIVNEFSVKNDNGITVKKFSTDFLMNDTGIDAHKTILQTTKTDLNASLAIHYSSLSAFVNSLEKVYVFADIKNATADSKELLYFAPQITSLPIRLDSVQSVSVKGKIWGPLGKLTGEHVDVHIGNSTSLQGNFRVSGIPAIKKMLLDISDLAIVTGKKDLINTLSSTMIPNGISLPEHIDVRVSGKGTLQSFQAALMVKTDFGNIAVKGTMGGGNSYAGDVAISDFNVGLLVKKTELFGPLTASLAFSGQGFDKNTMHAKVNLQAQSFHLNRYTYKNVTVDGDFTAQQYEGKMSLRDENAEFFFKGLVNLVPGKEQYDFSLDLIHANLQKINIAKNPLLVSGLVSVDLKGKNIDSLSGNVSVTNVLLVKDSTRFNVDSVGIALINKKGKNRIFLKSDIADAQYDGTASILAVIKEMKKFVNSYFILENTRQDTAFNNNGDNKKEPIQFSFGIQVHENPLLKGMFVPKLTSYSSAAFEGNYSGDKSMLVVRANVPSMVYSGIKVKNAAITISSDVNKMVFGLTTDSVASGPVVLKNLSVQGTLHDENAVIKISSVNNNGFKKLMVHNTIDFRNGRVRLVVDTADLYMGNEKCNVSTDNYVDFSEKGLLIHDLYLSSSYGQFGILSLGDTANGTIKMGVENFDVNALSRIITIDTSLIHGQLNGNVLLKKMQNHYGMVADAALTDFTIEKIKVGTFRLKTENLESDSYTIHASLSGEGNDLGLKGVINLQNVTSNLDVSVAVKALPLRTIEAFSRGTIREGSGSVNGQFDILGTTKNPKVQGVLTFNDVYFNPTALKNKLHLKNEKIEIKPTGIYFDQFTIIDQENQAAHVNGVITLNQLPKLGFGLKIDARDFLVFNTTKKDNGMFFGKMIVDSKIQITGTSSLPVIKSNLRLKNGSYMTFAVPEQSVNSSRGDGVVLFVDSLKRMPEKNTGLHENIMGFDIASDIQIDDKATLRLLVDPASNDSLVVRGGGSLHLGMNSNGKVDISGLYTLTEGNYIVSYKSVINRKFKIDRGGTILFNGSPTDADVNINAICIVNASPVNLLADQTANASMSSEYAKPLPFLVYLKIRGTILKPEISFEIQLRTEDKAVLNGGVQARLTQLNADPTLLDKQVFTLLAFGQFIRENPLESVIGNNSAIQNVARGGVSSFISDQLNQFGATIIPGVELNFDVQSYDDGLSKEGRTQVGIGVRKQLFKERLSVQIGGSVDVEGAKARQNSASDIAGDVVVEYKLTEDGRYRIKGFKKNIVEDPIDGQVTEYGVGITLTRAFNAWKSLFRKRNADREKKHAQ